MNFKHMKIATRLFLAFGLLVLLSLLSSGLALKELKDIEANLEDVVTDNNVKIALLNNMSDSLQMVMRRTGSLILMADDRDRATQSGKISAEIDKYTQTRGKLEKLEASPAGRAQRAAVDSAAARARSINAKVIALALANNLPQAATLLTQEAEPATEAWEASLEDNISFQEKLSAEQYREAQASYTTARNLLLGFALASLLASAALAVLVVRSIVSQLGGEPSEVAELARSIAEANLKSVIAVRSGDTTSVMAAMARMQESLTGIVSSVRGNADSVSMASAEIAQGNHDLSSRTESQASALQQTAASMEQLSATVKQNADSARQANQLALSASTVAIKGGDVVSQVVVTMKGINDSSRKIADIIQVIDGIAFQTNILALNAAVEAARAGEQGRGFAVVASEVRSLAGRSAEAAKEIKSLINASVERVEYGTVLVDQAGTTMAEVVGSIRRVTDLMGEISAASSEQSNGVSQVGEAVMQMDQVTQQNAALVEEMAAAASSLKSQAQDLVQTVGVFKLAGADEHHRLSARPLPRGQRHGFPESSPVLLEA